MSIPEVDSKNRLLAFLQKNLRRLENLSGYARKTGTPVDNQIAVWTSADTIEGRANLTYDASTGYWKLINISEQGCFVRIIAGDISEGTTIDTQDGLSTTAAPLTLKPNGRVVLQPKTANLTTFFQVKDQGGTAFVVGDSTNKILSLPYQPMVYAFRNSTQDLDPNTDWNTVIFNDDSTTNDTAFDVGTDYATGTGIFTAPADGKYLISAEVMLTNTTTTDGNIILKCITTNSAADGINQFAGRVNPDTFATEPDYVQLSLIHI